MEKVKVGLKMLNRTSGIHGMLVTDLCHNFCIFLRQYFGSVVVWVQSVEIHVSWYHAHTLKYRRKISWPGKAEIDTVWWYMPKSQVLELGIRYSYRMSIPFPEWPSPVLVVRGPPGCVLIVWDFPRKYSIVRVSPDQDQSQKSERSLENIASREFHKTKTNPKNQRFPLWKYSILRVSPDQD